MGLRQTADRVRNPFDNTVITRIAEVIYDPLAIVEEGQDVLDGAMRRPTSWMKRLASSGRAPTNVRESGVPEFDGRVCCAAHLKHFDGRNDLPVPFETDCPGCSRRFRVRLDLVRQRR